MGGYAPFRSRYFQRGILHNSGSRGVASVTASPPGPWETHVIKVKMQPDKTKLFISQKTTIWNEKGGCIWLHLSIASARRRATSIRGETRTRPELLPVPEPVLKTSADA